MGLTNPIFAANPLNLRLSNPIEEDDLLIIPIDQEELRKAAEDTGQETEARTLLGELFEIYYDNRSTQSCPSTLFSSHNIKMCLKSNSRKCANNTTIIKQYTSSIVNTNEEW